MLVSFNYLYYLLGVIFYLLMFFVEVEYDFKFFNSNVVLKVGEDFLGRKGIIKVCG